MLGRDSAAREGAEQDALEAKQGALRKALSAAAEVVHDVIGKLSRQRHEPLPRHKKVAGVLSDTASFLARLRAARELSGRNESHASSLKRPRPLQNTSASPAREAPAASREATVPSLH